MTITEEYLLDSTYQLSQYAPKFLWILRDFVLEIKDLRGRTVTPKLYLESVLTDLPVGENGFTRNAEQSFKIRESILNFFKTRDCLTLIRPVNDEEDLRNIQHLNDNQIRPKFLTQLHAIRDKIYKECNQKVINGVGLNMTMFISFLNQFVQSFNHGKMPAIQTAWKNLLETECSNMYEKAINRYEAEVKSFKDSNESPQNTDLYKHLNLLRDFTMNYYSGCCYIQERDPDVYEKYQNQLKEYIDQRQHSIVADFNEKSDNLNNDYVNNLYRTFINNNTFDDKTPEDVSNLYKEEIIEKY